MATIQERIQELQNAREEITQRIGNTMALFKSIDGEQPEALKEDMIKCAEQGSECWLSAVKRITKMIELLREQEGP